MAEDDMNERVRIALVEDDAGTRSALVSLLGWEPGFEVVGVHGSGEEAMEQLPAEKPDVVLMDIQLPGMSGIDVVRNLAGAMPGLSMVMLTTFEDADRILESIRAGAHGYLIKDSPVRELIDGIRQVHRGGSPMSLGVARRVVEHLRGAVRPVQGVAGLSDRENQVLAALAAGRRIKAISHDMGLSDGTVRTYVRRVYEKLHVTSRTEAAARFLRGEG